MPLCPLCLCGDFMHLLLAIALFRAPNFPTVDAPPIPDRVLEQALAGLDVVSIDKLKEARLLVLPYGSAFPLDEYLAGLGGQADAAGG